MATINDLPPEILFKILKELDTEKCWEWYWSGLEQASVNVTIIPCRRVCRLWKEMIESRFPNAISSYKFWADQLDCGDIEGELMPEENWEVEMGSEQCRQM